MTDILIIGFSSIVQRRVMPALVSLTEIGKIYIASEKELSADVIPAEKRGGVFKGYANALSRCKQCLVYISLPNSMHAKWALRALNEGFHVIVDKPSVINVSDAEKLIEAAGQGELCLAEANVWYYHPLAQVLKNIIKEEKKVPLIVSAVFSSPPLNPGNFRYNTSLGSGVLLDRGSYAVSCGRILFDNVPQKIICEVNSSDKNSGIDLSFNVMMMYPEGGVLQGFFSLEAEYHNMVSVIGQDYYLETDKIFTPPADYSGGINIRRKNKKEFIAVPADDTFALFIKDVLSSIHDKSFNRFARVLIEDSMVLNRLIKSSKGG